MTAREKTYYRSGCHLGCQDFYNYCRAVERVLEGGY